MSLAAASFFAMPLDFAISGDKWRQGAPLDLGQRLSLFNCIPVIGLTWVLDAGDVLFEARRRAFFKLRVVGKDSHAYAD